MAKDSKGHGSESRSVGSWKPIKGSSFSKLSNEPDHADKYFKNVKKVRGSYGDLGAGMTRNYPRSKG